MVLSCRLSSHFIRVHSWGRPACRVVVFASMKLHFVGIAATDWARPCLDHFMPPVRGTCKSAQSKCHWYISRNTCVVVQMFSKYMVYFSSQTLFDQYGQMRYEVEGSERFFI